MRTMGMTHRWVLVEVVEEYIMEVVVEEEKSQWWGPHEKRRLEQWKITEAWRCVGTCFDEDLCDACHLKL